MKIHGRLDKDIKKRKYHPILWSWDVNRDRFIDKDFFCFEKKDQLGKIFMFPLLLWFSELIFVSIYMAIFLFSDQLDIKIYFIVIFVAPTVIFLLQCILFTNFFGWFALIPIIKTINWIDSIKKLPEPAFERELDKKVRSTSWFWFFYSETYKDYKKQNSPIMKKYMAEINEYCDTHKMKPEVETEYTIRRLNQLLKAKTITKEQYDLMGDELFLGAWDQFEKEKKLYR